MQSLSQAIKDIKFTSVLAFIKMFIDMREKRNTNLLINNSMIEFNAPNYTKLLFCIIRYRLLSVNKL